MNAKTIAISAAGILVIAVIGTATYFNKTNKETLGSLDNEKIKTEQLLSEKLLLEKEIERIKLDLTNVNGEKAALSESLKKQLALASAHKNTNSNNKNNKTITSLKKEIEALKKLKTSLNAELATALQKIKTLESSSDDLQKQIAVLNANNKKLGEDLALMRSVNGDQFDLAAYKGKSEKLTVKAKKVKKLSARFTIPSYVVTNAGFKIKMPDGQIIDKMAKGMSMTILNDIEEMYADVNGSQPTETMKQIEVTYTPEGKLKPGAYKIELYNGANYITSCIINLN